jgi:hypothetical protein
MVRDDEEQRFKLQRPAPLVPHTKGILKSLTN